MDTTILSNCSLHICNTDMNAKDDFGRTAFMLACRKGHTDVVKFLLDETLHATKVASNLRRSPKCIKACFRFQLQVSPIFTASFLLSPKILQSEEIFCGIHTCLDTRLSLFVA